ncbi:trace amine-associated receptor 13c-like [Corythoichthys intestinalis]|uniref:trace amine-associated receptor 13c-like n=1 Tax=Corythoichthys intestinalis TaxID=161448 RepID=UPI0025A64C21|nr:trace amine-associated receptor 13c-like [Corythoichthys intestinalis]XP_061799132.1 trace amine-associated receptor 13c-like [Nerophis lumbriciformis]
MERVNRSELCFPQLANLSCRKSSSSFSEGVFLSVLLPSTGILTVLLNLLVIVAISHFRQLHTPTNLLLLSLAITDILVGLLMMSAVMYMTSSCWMLGDILCCLFALTLVLVTTASVGNMVLISADRYVAICNPLQYNVKITLKRIQISVCLCWISSLLYCWIILNEQIVHPGKFNSCYGECVIKADIIGGIFDVIFTFILPLTVIITLYTRVFVIAVSQARAMRSQVTRGKVLNFVFIGPKKSELKAARTLGVLVFVFLVCFCPYYSVSLIGDNRLPSKFKSYFAYMYLFNSCMNPLIYVLFYPWFRRAIRLIVTLHILCPGSRDTKVM